MEDEKIQPMWIVGLSTILMLLLNGVDGICPSGCKCENDILKANCSGANIEFVPIQLNPEIVTLDLSRNRITHLHYTFSFYEKLLTLDLSVNKINSLGNGNFRSQKMLKYLNVSNNAIETLSKESLDGLDSCTHLDLSNNKLEKIAEHALRDLHSLKVLRLNANQLDYFEEELFKPTINLEELHLDDNLFFEIPDTLSDLTNLKFLSLSRNLIEILEDGKVPNLPELHALVLVQNILIEIQPGAFSSLPKLDHLDLSDNNLTVLPTTQLAKLSRLSNLKLSGNSFDSLPPVAFRGLFHLKYLSLNRLEFISCIDPRAFVDNINLEKISMDFNIRITKLPTRVFHGNPKLSYISIRYNSITTLEASHFPLDQLTDLKVGGNPLECNCTMGWLWNLIQENDHKSRNTIVSNQVTQKRVSEETKDSSTVSNSKSKIKKPVDLKLDVNEIICAKPENLQGQKLVTASKRQMDCSVGWLAIVSVTCTIVFTVAVIGGILFWIPKRRSKQKNNEKELHKTIKHPSRGALPPCPPPRKAPPYDVGLERYVIPTPVLIQNCSVPMWESYNQQCNGNMNLNIYEQINEARERPHIVYV